MSAETLLKNGEVSAMIKQGFLPSPSSSPPSTTTTTTTHPSPPTLFHLLSKESPSPSNPTPPSHLQRRLRIQSRISRILLNEPSTTCGPPDVDLSVSSSDGFRLSMSVHRRVLAARSRFFKDNLGKKGGVVEICDCDDVEVYVEVVALMYCSHLKLRLAGDDVTRVLALLKVSSAIMFDSGVSACLEHLESVPWSEDEEAEVVSVLNQLQLQLHKPTTEVLERVLVASSACSRADAIFLQLLAGILQAKDEKARRDMKELITGLLRQDTAVNNASRFDVSRETLYHLCHKCLNLLISLAGVATTDEGRRDRGNLMGDIARQADNLHWLLEILITKKMGDEFVTLWAEQTELASLHSKIPCMYRFEISKVTAQLCIAVGKGNILVPKEARFSLLETWLEALYNDFSWMKRACRTVDKKMVEDGLSQTILTLPMAQQQTILLRWFDRFLKKGDDCPNIQGAFEVWWRRAFVRRYEGEHAPSQLQIAVCDYSK